MRSDQLFCLLSYTRAFYKRRQKSQELKRSFSCPSPSPPPCLIPSPPPCLKPSPSLPSPPPSHPSSRDGHFKVPRKYRKTLGPKSLNFRQSDKQKDPTTQKFVFPSNLDKEYPALSAGCSENRCKLPFEEFLQSSYAQAVAPRSTKRTISDRPHLSPIDVQPKRSALSGLIKTPTELKTESRLPVRDGVVMSTPKEVTSEVLPMEEDSCTPNNDRYLRPKFGLPTCPHLLWDTSASRSDLFSLLSFLPPSLPLSFHPQW